MVELEFKREFTEDCDLRDDATINLDTWEIEIIIQSICDDFIDAMENEKVPHSVNTKVILGVHRNLFSKLKTKDFWAPKDFLECLEYVRYNSRSGGNKKENEVEMSENKQENKIQISKVENLFSEVVETKVPKMRWAKYLTKCLKLRWEKMRYQKLMMMEINLSIVWRHYGYIMMKFSSPKERTKKKEKVPRGLIVS